MPTEINQFNLNVGLLNKYRTLIYHHSYWHQIVVENVEGLDRDALLKTLMKFCYPYDLIPVSYSSSKNTATFLLKNCGSAVEKMCLQNLIITNPYDKDKPFKLSVKLGFANSNDLKINIQINLNNVLNKRFNQETGILNLEHFAKDPDLQEYCALCQPKLFFYILHLSKNIQFKTLKLAHNDIEILKPMEALEGVKHAITIDLRNNNIKHMLEVANMKHLNLTELWLDGNPICDNYNEFNYGKVVKESLEKLEKLDGVNLQAKGFLSYRRNFLCNLTGFDLVDQFLEHYFTLYDARNRSVLDGVYHKDAMFSITSMYIPSQSTSSNANLSAYKKVSRNLKQISDFSKNTQCLFKGPYQIIKVLSSLPFSEHDPYSFTVDLVMYTESIAVLVVCGIFRESSESLLESDRLLGFTRTFVLLAGQDGEYSIINEMLNITNATTTQASKAFKHVRIPKPQFIYLPQPQNSKDKLDMAEALKAVTGLKFDWARKCLEECKYDMKEALTLFIELFKIDKIPKSAFIREGGNPDDKYDPLASPVMSDHFIPTSAQSTNQPNRSQPVTPFFAKEIPSINNFRALSPSAESLKPPHQTSRTQSLRNIPIEREIRSSRDDAIEVIDLLSSPENDRGSSPMHIRGITSASSGMVGEPGLFDPTSRKMKKACRQVHEAAFRKHFEKLKDLYKDKGYAESVGVAVRILKDNPLEYTIFEEVITWYYKTNLMEGRKFKKEVEDIANVIKTKFITPILLYLITAKCEYIYGDKAKGKSEYMDLMRTRPMEWARPVTEFCKTLLEQNEVEEAKLLLRPYFRNSHPLKQKIVRIVKMLSKQFKVNLIY